MNNIEKMNEIEFKFGNPKLMPSKTFEQVLINGEAVESKLIHVEIVGNLCKLLFDGEKRFVAGRIKGIPENKECAMCVIIGPNVDMNLPADGNRTIGRIRFLGHEVLMESLNLAFNQGETAKSSGRTIDGIWLMSSHVALVVK